VGDAISRVDGRGGDEDREEEADKKAVSCSIVAISFVDVCDGFASI
jgi:hypothetical protein